MIDKTPSEQIDDIISQYGGWKGGIITRLRDVILAADPTITEAIKWEMATRPEGLPVWEQNGIICFIETWKDNSKLLFPKGALLEDPQRLFNARLNSAMVRAIEFHEGDEIDRAGLTNLILNAIKQNQKKVSLPPS